MTSRSAAPVTLTGWGEDGMIGRPVL